MFSWIHVKSRRFFVSDAPSASPPARVTRYTSQNVAEAERSSPSAATPTPYSGRPTSATSVMATPTALNLISIVILILGLSYALVPLYQLYCQAYGSGGTVWTPPWKLVPPTSSPPPYPASEAVGKDSGDAEVRANRVEVQTKSPPPITIHFNADSVSLNARDPLVSGEPHVPIRDTSTEAGTLALLNKTSTSSEAGTDLFFRPNIDKIHVYPGDSALSFYTIHNKTNMPISGISVYNIIPQKAGIYFNKIQCFCFEEQRLKPNESVEMPILFYIDSDFEKDPKMEDVNSIILSYTFYQCAPGSGAQAALLSEQDGQSVRVSP
uniref:Heme biosynthesis protein n=1 Tax=Marophrys sp. SRT127 TaxID=2488311 RepID=A0A455RGE9_9EUKA|nr:heme biosynthesis protein [Marophrys sp. SRT127]